MSEPFDPYYQWLGIQPENQPPDHYRLLGIKPFEDDPAVIDSAADQRMVYLRTFQLGQHSQHSQQLLNQVAAARVCLQAPEKKAAYDQQLRATRKPEVQPPAPPPFKDVTPPIVAPGAVWLTASPATAPPPREGPPSMIVVGIMALLATVGVVLAAVLLRPASSPAPAATSGQTTQVAGRTGGALPTGMNSAETTSSTRTEPSTTRSSSQVQPDGSARGGPNPAQASLPAAPAESNLGAQGDSPADTRLLPSSEPPANQRVADAPASVPAGDTGTPVEPQELPPTEGAPGKRPVPGSDTQAALVQRVNSLLKLSGTKSHEEQLAAAHELYELGQKTQDKPDEQFVILRRAMELAQEGGDAALMLEIIEAMEERFDLDAINAKTVALEGFADKATDVDRVASFITAAGGVVDQALQERRYPAAFRLINAVYSACSRPGGGPYRKETFDRRKEIERLCQRWRDAEAAQEALAANPNDPDANLVVARWHCMVLEDWPSGLPHAAKSSDPQLRSHASRELQLAPGSAEERVQVADAWWGYAEQIDGEGKEAVWRHAGELYRQAAAELPAGLAKAAAERRLKELAGQTPSAAAAPARAGSGGRAADKGELPVELVNSVDIRLRLIPAGEFMMGSSDSDRYAEADEKPPHRVLIAHPFYIGQHEVTVGQFRRFVMDTGYITAAERNSAGGWRAGGSSSKGRYTPDTNWRNPGYPLTDGHPVSVVDWSDAMAFCKWLTKREREEYRLPTEAEWEYACRAGTTEERHSGSEALELFGWHAHNSSIRAWPVGQKKPNPWGIHDMYGNVREWCFDWYDAAYFKGSPVEDPQGPETGQERSSRGSCFMDYSPFIRSAKRLQWPVDWRCNNQGFRVVRLVRPQSRR